MLGWFPYGSRMVATPTPTSGGISPHSMPLQLGPKQLGATALHPGQLSAAKPKSFWIYRN